MNPDWSTYVAPAIEIRAYVEKIVSHFGLKSFISLNTGVEKAEWDQVTKSWRVQTLQGEIMKATHLVSGCGVLRRPVIPKFKGLDTFKGKVFHTAEWDQDYDYKAQSVIFPKIVTRVTTVKSVTHVTKSHNSHISHKFHKCDNSHNSHKCHNSHKNHESQMSQVSFFRKLPPK
jgi:hypothetical protein